MPTVAEIMTRDVLTVEPEMTLRAAIEVLTADEVTGAPVVSGSRVVGVISLTDLATFRESEPGVPTQREGQVEWGEMESSVAADEDMAENPSSYFVDFWADAGADIYERMSESESPEWNVLEDHTVSEIMTRQVVALPPDATIRDAARLMTEREIHRILITRDDRLEGIVTTMDVVRAVAEGRAG
jgi:CBS domain-containing protein